jgi:hypothetical protein
MKAIWKYPLGITDIQTVSMPKGAEILTVQIQLGGVCLWAMVDPEAPKEDRIIITYGTGHPIDSPHLLRYIGTYQIPERVLVFHVFEKQD